MILERIRKEIALGHNEFTLGLLQIMELSAHQKAMCIQGQGSWFLIDTETGVTADIYESDQEDLFEIRSYS